MIGGQSGDGALRVAGKTAEYYTLSAGSFGRQGAVASMTSTTMTRDVYAFPFGQHGLMAGLGLGGSKIPRILPRA